MSRVPETTIPIQSEVTGEEGTRLGGRTTAEHWLSIYEALSSTSGQEKKKEKAGVLN